MNALSTPQGVSRAVLTDAPRLPYVAGGWTSDTGEGPISAAIVCGIRRFDLSRIPEPGSVADHVAARLAESLVAYCYYGSATISALEVEQLGRAEGRRQALSRALDSFWKINGALPDMILAAPTLSSSPRDGRPWWMDPEHDKSRAIAAAALIATYSRLMTAGA